MTTSTNSLQFTRVYSDGVYYSDLKARLRYAVKFDVFNDKDQIATLVTNNTKTYSLLKDNTRLSLKSKWRWLNKWRYSIFKSDSILLSTIYVHQPIFFGLFRPSIYEITFVETNFTYSLTERKRKEWKYVNAEFQYDFTLDDKVKCSIINLKKIKGLYNPRTITQEGIIEYDETINLYQILCFLQFMNIYIDLEFDI